MVRTETLVDTLADYFNILVFICSHNNLLNLRNTLVQTFAVVKADIDRTVEVET